MTDMLGPSIAQSQNISDSLINLTALEAMVSKIGICFLPSIFSSNNQDRQIIL